MKIALVCFLAIILERHHFVSAYVSPVLSRIQCRSELTSNLCSLSSHHKSKLSMSRADESNHSEIMSSPNDFRRNRRFLRIVGEEAPVVIQRLGNFLLPLVFQLSILVLFSFVHPALAKTVKKSISKAGAVAIKSPPLWKKILEGRFALRLRLSRCWVFDIDDVGQ